MIKQFSRRVDVHSHSLALASVHGIGSLVAPQQQSSCRVQPIRKHVVVRLLGAIHATRLPHHKVKGEDERESCERDKVGRPCFGKVGGTGSPQGVDVGCQKGRVWTGKVGPKNKGASTLLGDGGATREFGE